MSNEGAKVLTYLDKLIADQSRVLLEGGTPDGSAQITRIEEYRAGVMLVRNMRRLRVAVEETFDQAAADEINDGLQPLEET